MRGILCLLDARASKAFQRSRKEKEQVENVKLLLNHSLVTPLPKDRRTVFPKTKPYSII
ncbi:MAG: hypothetical protein AAF573_20775 [Bacteroidota bacterium]